MILTKMTHSSSHGHHRSIKNCLLFVNIIMKKLRNQRLDKKKSNLLTKTTKTITSKKNAMHPTEIPAISPSDKLFESKVLGLGVGWIGVVGLHFASSAAD